MQKVPSNIFQLFVLVLISLQCSCSESTPSLSRDKESKQLTVPTNDDFSSQKEKLAESVGTQAYLFGASIMTQMYFRNRLRKMVETSQNPSSPIKFSAAAADGLHFNELLHTRNLTNHEMKIGGTPNVDTRYSVVVFNLEHGAQVLTVPAIKNRYYSVNITDAYLGNKPYICSRNGDVNGGNYLFTGPDWKGKLPAGMKEIKMPQNNFLVVVRIYVKDPQTDNENVTAIQDEFALQSLNKFTGRVATDKLIPVEPVKMNKGVAYFQQMIDFMKANPPEGEQHFIWNMFRQVGVTPDGVFDISVIDEPTRLGLEKGIESGREIIQWKARNRSGQTDSGWFYSYTMGVDHEDYLHRSEWAVQGLTVGSPIEAMFFNTFVDGAGNKLDGNNTYTIHIPEDKMPPVNEFWSITSYGEDFDVVPNSNYHYGVGIRNKEMKYNADGSLTFKVQSEKPVEGLWNWIPIPDNGPFKLTFRFYNPKEVMFDKDQVSDYLPPVAKVDLRD